MMRNGPPASGLGPQAVVAGVVLGLAAPAHADVDWARGLVIADGVGVADRHAPNPAVARGTSRRVAEQAAKQELARLVEELPLAAGGKVGSKAKDGKVKQRLARAVDHAITLAADPETDGAWRVTMAVPIEAVRQAIDGGRVLDAPDAGPAAVIIDGASAKPGVGVKVGGLTGAAIWVKTVPDWAKDAPRVKAKAAKAGTIEVDGLDASPSTLFLIVSGSP